MCTTWRLTGGADGWPLQLRNHYILPNHHQRALQDVTADNRRFTERRKKTVRFDHEDGAWPPGWDEERQGSQDSQTKDSGIDTSSTFTSSEDSNRGDVPKVGVMGGQRVRSCWFVIPFTNILSYIYITRFKRLIWEIKHWKYSRWWHELYMEFDVLIPSASQVWNLNIITLFNCEPQNFI